MNMIANAMRSVLRGITGQPEMYDGNRDINSSCGYPDEPAPAEYDWMYKRFGVAKRVVNILPDESWKVLPTVRDTEDAEESPWEKEVVALNDKFKFFNYLTRLDRTCGIHSYGVLFFGLDDVENSNQLIQPVASKANLLYLKVFNGERAQVATYDTDATSPRYGLPETYRLDFAEPLAQGSAGIATQTVHHSRVLHVADNLEDGESFGEPRLRPVYNRLLDLRKLYGGSGEMFWQGANQGLAMNIDPNADLSDDDFARFQTQMDDYSQGLSRKIVTQGGSIQTLGAQVADPTKHLMAQLQFIATTIGVPLRVLLGSEQAQLASSQDTANWNSRLHRRQVDHNGPRILKPFLDKMIELGMLPVPKNNEYQTHWQDLDTLSDMDKAVVAKAESEAINIYASGASGGVVERDIWLRETMGWDDKTIVANGEAIDGTELLVADEDDLDITDED